MEELLEFAKYHGAGNDFIIIDDMEGRISLGAEQVALLCDRHFGIGADGVMIARPSSKADAYMLYYNSDGSLAEMCGNGIRCFAKFLFDRNIVLKKKVGIETLAGVKEVELIFDGPEVVGAEVEMGKPSFRAGDVPTTLVDSDSEAVDVNLSLPRGEIIVSCVSVGNPHCVVFVDDVEQAPVEELGPVIENHPAFPEKTNVEFAEIVDSNRIKVRVWERGAGLTLACGTGAVAVAAAACRRGFCSYPVRIDLPGGHLLVEFDDDKNAYLAGPAEHVFNGFLSFEFSRKLTEKEDDAF